MVVVVVRVMLGDAALAGVRGVVMVEVVVTVVVVLVVEQTSVRLGLSGALKL